MFPRVSSKVSIEWLAFLIRTPVVPSSNLGPEAAIMTDVSHVWL
jgi:hypothetical protein